MAASSRPGVTLTALRAVALAQQATGQLRIAITSGDPWRMSNQAWNAAEPLLRAAAAAMDAGGFGDGEEQRRALRQAIGAYLDPPAPRVDRARPSFLASVTEGWARRFWRRQPRWRETRHA